MDRRSLTVAAVGAGFLAGRAMRRHSRTIDLVGKVVMITGGSRGLGLVMTKEFARHGAKLSICARGADGLDWARRELVQEGAEVFTYPCDVSDREQVQRWVDLTLDHYGRVDVLVNNAGIISVGPLESQTLTDFEQAMDVMFWGAVYPTLAVLPQMRAQGSGRIVNITSIGGKVSVPHLLPYSSAKFAAVGFSEGLHAELGRAGIDVVTVVPGLMRTGSHVNALYKGHNRAEYGWFSLGASLPITSTSAERAAKLIVAATRRGDAVLIITPQAQALARFHGLFPGFTSEVLSLVNRLLPPPGGIGTARRAGKQSESVVSESFLTELGQRAAEDHHQYPESAGYDPAPQVPN